MPMSCRSDSGRDLEGAPALHASAHHGALPSPQERFRTRFGGAPLVVGGERKWYPLPRDAHDPFGPDPRLPWKVKYTARRARQYYPNSGLVMGVLASLDDS